MKRLLVCVAMIAMLAGRAAAGEPNGAAEKKQHLISQANGPQVTSPTVTSSKVTGTQVSGQQVVAGNKSVAADPADFVGSETCSTCHQDVVKKFSANPHSRLALMHSGKGVTCESCHGPARAHVESGGDASKIFRFSKASPKEVDETCLTCHAGTHPNFERSAHGHANVGCASCHSVHDAHGEAGMLKVAQPKLCYTCHTDVKAAFAKPFHHKVDEGLIGCSDCHNPHGTFQSRQLNATADQNTICAKCHTETAGPFIYQHPPIKTEGCSSCHTPHGSPNPRLLTRNNVNSLCLQCHSQSALFTAPEFPSFHNQAAQYQACTVCHTQVHGSNANAFFFK